MLFFRQVHLNSHNEKKRLTFLIWKQVKNKEGYGISGGGWHWDIHDNKMSFILELIT